MTGNALTQLWSGPLERVEPEIRAALVQLVAMPETVGGYVIVENDVTERFVQFAGSTAKLVLDLPVTKHQRIDAAGVARAAALLPDRHVPNGADYYTLMRRVSIDEGVALAMEILRDVLRLPDEAHLVVRVGISSDVTALN